MRSSSTAVYLVLMGLLLPAIPAAAQYQFGDAQLSKFSGILGAGYSGAYGNQESSSHQLGLNGSASLNGFYYNPNFLSFDFTPYYDQSRANSSSRSVGESTGLAFSSAIFAGSHFPGTVSYTRDYNSSGTFAVPGVPDLTSHGNAQNLGLSWGINLPELPNLSVFYNRSNSSASLYGSDATSDAASQTFGLRSLYDLDGFRLNASYNHAGSHSEMPAFLQSQAMSSSSTSDGYSFGVSHKLPFNGGASVGYNHSNFTSESLGYHNNGSVNNAFANISLNPSAKLGLTGNVNYVDNLAANLTEALLNAGVPGQLFTSSTSHSLDMNAQATYRLTSDISVDAVAGRRDQSFLGQTYSSTMLGAGASTSRAFLGGTISGLVRVADFRSDGVAGNKGTSSVSLITSGNYARDLGRWRITGNFSYSQNQQTLLISYLTSFYSYGASVYHPIWKLRWSGAFAGTHSGYVQQAGTSNRSESFSTSLGSRHLTGSAGYSNSNGIGVLTPTGFTPPPVPILSQQILFGGKNYNFSLGSSPIRRLTISASYSTSHGNTTSSDLASSFHTRSLNALVQYRFRQMGFTGGYSQLHQGFSLAGGKPFEGTTFFVGVNRWFDFF
jgi:Outer membrane protein beta-barrel family